MTMSTTSTAGTTPPPDENGWTSISVDPTVVLGGKSYITEPTPLPASEIMFPTDSVVINVQKYAREHLPGKVYNHSMRVYYFSMAILAQQFPTQPLSPSTLALTCLLHDIGATPANLGGTRMSFEFFGGMEAYRLVLENGGSKDQAEAVCEAIIRHQDLGTDGTITLLGQVIQLATIYDNAGGNPEIIHEMTREDVVKLFPRDGWLGCFADTIREEMSRKPWCHSTHIPGFIEHVRGNKLFAKYG